MTRPQVLYVGDRNWPELAVPVRWLIDHVDLTFETDGTIASTAAASQVVPFDVIVIAQRRPGEYPHAIFDELRAAAPLTPIVCLLGSLCEGEARTGTPWPGAVRVYAHQFVARIAAQLECFASKGTTAWAPPFTATDEDRSLASSPLTIPRLSAHVAVISRNCQTASVVCDALQSAGCSSTRHGEDLAGLDDNADVIVWDCAAGFDSSAASFDRLVQQFLRTPKIVLVGFPRADDTATAIAHGAAAVVSKPFLVEDLLWQVGECLGMDT